MGSTSTLAATEHTSLLIEGGCGGGKGEHNHYNHHHHQHPLGTDDNAKDDYDDNGDEDNHESGMGRCHPFLVL